jgi:hypothetical protein
MSNPRMLLTLPEEIQLAIRIAAAKKVDGSSRSTTSAVIIELVRDYMSLEVREAKKRIAKRKRKK